MSEAPRRLTVGITDVMFGRNVTVVEPANIYRCSIGDHCFIGPFVEIQAGVSIGAGTRVQSHTFICELVRIGVGCFVGHGVMFINDRFRSGGPARGDRALWESTVIGDNVSIGSNVTLLPVHVHDGCVIGAGSVVTRDLRIKGIYAGNPARLIRELL